MTRHRLWPVGRVGAVIWVGPRPVDTVPALPDTWRSLSLTEINQRHSKTTAQLDGYGRNYEFLHLFNFFLLALLSQLLQITYNNYITISKCNNHHAELWSRNGHILPEILSVKVKDGWHYGSVTKDCINAPIIAVPPRTMHHQPLPHSYRGPHQAVHHKGSNPTNLGLS